MAKIDLKFMKGNKETLAAMRQTYGKKPKQKVKRTKSAKGKK